MIFNTQLSKLPGKEFWTKLPKLKILFLHNNPIGKLEYLKNLSFCPSLEYPLKFKSKLQTSYRQFNLIIKSIYYFYYFILLAVIFIYKKLQFLDDFVISDEEIIEEAKFNNKFSTKSENFRINFRVMPAPVKYNINSF